MIYKKLGNCELKVSAIGLGCMGMNYGYGIPDDTESIKTLHRALDLGINFLDTADAYANGMNEELISKVLVPNRDKIVLATKFGFTHTIRGAGRMISSLDCSPVYLRKAVEDSLKRLGIHEIDLYYAHRVDPKVPIEETVGAMGELVKEGKVKAIGICEASADTIRRAHAIHPLTAVQSEYSLLTRDLEKEVLPTIRALGITMIPFSPLARGLMTDDSIDVNALPSKDFRRSVPRYNGENLQNNLSLAGEFKRFASSLGCTAAQLAIAWVLHQGEDIIPIPGTKKQKYLIENAKAVDVKLSESDLSNVEQILAKYPNIGNRYDDNGMQMLNR